MDEFHHAAAPTYQQLLNYFKPRILLGLTATPEHMDGENILRWFDNRIAAEIRLPEAKVRFTCANVNSLHNRNRPYISGEGTFDDVLRGIEKNVPEGSAR